MGPIQSIGDFVDMVLRRFCIMAAVGFVGVVITLAVVVDIERVYETTAVIEFDLPIVSSGDRTTQTQQGNARQQLLQIIQQRLMTRESLTDIIERYDLFSDAAGLTMAERVTALRGSTTFQQVPAVQAGPEGQRLAAMLITVRLDDPQLVADLANEFARRVVSDTYRSVASRTDETLQLLRAQEARSAEAIRRIEQRIKDFKVRNQEALPEGQSIRIEELQRVQESLHALDRSVQELERERRVFETYGRRSMWGTGGPSLPDSSPAEEELRRLDLELVRLRLSSPSSPMIERLEALIQVLNQRADELREEGREQFFGDIDSQIALLNSQREAIAQRRSELQAAIAKAPSAELELAALNLDFALAQERYSVAANRLAEAENAQMVLEAEQSVSMRLLEPAITPEYPVGPSRMRAAMLGIGISGLVALAIGFALELMNPVLRSGSSVVSRTGLTPVVTVPEIRGSGDWALGVGRYFALVLFCAGVVFVAAKVSPPFEAFLMEIVDQGLGMIGPVPA